MIGFTYIDEAYELVLKLEGDGMQAKELSPEQKVRSLLPTIPN
jgi:hypothetical protein